VDGWVNQNKNVSREKEDYKRKGNKKKVCLGEGIFTTTPSRRGEGRSEWCLGKREGV